MIQINGFLGELTPEALSSAIENNHNEFHVFVGKNGQEAFCDKGDVYWVINTPFAWPNYIFDARFEEHGAEKRIMNIIGDIESGAAPREWIVCPNSNPSNLGYLLEKSGFYKYESWPGMAIDLANLKDMQPPEGIEVRKIREKEDLPPWASVVSKELFHGGGIDIRHLEMLLSKSELGFYFALYEGRIVGTSMVFFSSDTAGIYMVSTQSDMRGMGIGRAVTLAPLIDARNMGYRAAILQSTSMGEPLYRKLGFKSYCTIYGYRWKYTPEARQ